MRSYDAFISYSHAKDKLIAQAFQSVAQDVGRAWWQRRALRIFRDDSSLAATPALWPEIQSALECSRFLVLFASPEAAASHWVNKEVEHWLHAKGPHTLLIALTAGDLRWDDASGDFAHSTEPVLPPAMRRAFMAEPKWVDLRPYRQGGETASKRNPDFLMRTADLSAAVHGIPKEDLLSEELRQQKRALAMASTAAFCLAVLAVTAAWQAYVANQERARVEKVLAQGARSANTLVSDLAERFRGQKNIPQKFIIDVLDHGRSLVTDLAETGGMRPELLQLQGKALAELSKTLRAQGDATAAVADATAALTAFQTLLANDGSNTEWAIGLAASYDRLGDASFDLGRHGDAEQAYLKSLEVSKSIGESGGGINRENIAVGEEKVAEIWIAQNKQQDAAAALQRSLAIREQLAAASPERRDLSRAINVSRGKLSEVLVALKDMAEAERHQRARVASASQLSAAEPENNDIRRELAQAHRGLASVLSTQDKAAEAFDNSKQDVEIIKALAAEDPDRTDWQLEVIAATERAGGILLTSSKADDALAMFTASQEAANHLASKNPGQPVLQYTLAKAHRRVGDALRALEQSERALERYSKGLAVRLRLPAFPASPAAWEYDTENAYQAACDLLLDMGRAGDAVALANERVERFEKLNANHTGREALRAQALGSLAWYALFHGDYAKALQASEAAAKLRPEKIWINLNRAHALMLAGETDEAVAAYLTHRDEMVTPELKWQDAVSADFATLRKAGRESPLMAEIEARLQ